jgi:hypothetical protein
MFNSRYSEPEMQQWHDACTDSANTGSDMPRHNDARTSVAKGQAEKHQSRTATAAMRMNASQQSASQTHEPRQDWASECLFDCYNG